jgi:hypothetical protein
VRRNEQTVTQRCPKRSPALAMVQDPMTPPMLSRSRATTAEPRAYPAVYMSSGSQVPRPYQVSRARKVAAQKHSEGRAARA